MNQTSFRVFLEQQYLFCDGLKAYDPNVWFPPLRGNFKLDTPGNWFICYVPSSWGRWKGGTYGVHIGFLYARARADRPESFRLAVGVESPMAAEYRQKFKEDVIDKLASSGISKSGFTLQAADRKKLLEVDPIPFGPDSWRNALDMNAALQPVVRLIGNLVADYAGRGAFTTDIMFQREEKDQMDQMAKLLSFFK